VTRFRAVLDSIEEHRDASVTVRDLAAVVPLGPSPFARTLQAPTGLRPRTGPSSPALSSGPSTSSAAGTTSRWRRSRPRDKSHFTRHFTRLVGVTTKHFR
jgi:hypothetical protein